MSRLITAGVTDQSIVFWAYDADDNVVDLDESSDGLTLSFRVDANGREGTPVSMTPIARSVAGQHEDGAITSLGSGKHEVDLPDAAFPTADRVVTVVVTADDVTTIIAERLQVKAAWATPVDVAITVTPLTGVVESGVSGTNIATYTGESKTVAIAVVDATGASVDLTGLTLSVVIEKYESQSDVATVEDADIDVSGSTVTFAIPSEVTETVGDKPWSLWTSGNVLLLRGIISVQYTPKQST